MVDIEKVKGVSSDGGFKIHISRIPAIFDEEIVERIITEKIREFGYSNDCDEGENKTTDLQLEALNFDLVYHREEQEAVDNPDIDNGAENKADGRKEHRGFGFLTMSSQVIYEKLIKLQTIKGGRKPTSKKLHKMYLRPYASTEEDTNQCYLWTQRRCPYGEDCKFSHAGPGACLEQKELTEEEILANKKKKRGKCFAFKKGKCEKGEDCPFSHDFEPKIPIRPKDIQTGKGLASTSRESRPKAEKDCINWKTKGKCRKGDACPYRHDPDILKKALDNAKKRKGRGEDSENTAKEAKKQKQPLCIRVFGMAYETTEEDIKEFFRHCGKIVDIKFPTFEDSGRSKGYCGIWFASPKAVAKSIELNGQELFGRWLSIQAGKMYLKKWEENHQKRETDITDLQQLSN